MLTQNVEFCSKMSLEDFITPRARSPTPYLALFCGVAAQPARTDRLGHWCSSFTPSINYVPHITPMTPVPILLFFRSVKPSYLLIRQYFQIIGLTDSLNWPISNHLTPSGSTTCSMWLCTVRNLGLVIWWSYNMPCIDQFRVDETS